MTVKRSVASSSSGEEMPVKRQRTEWGWQWKAAARTIKCLPGLSARCKDMILATLEGVHAYRQNRDDMRALGKELCEVVERLGGLPRKVAQQLSQLPDMVPNSTLREAMQKLQGNNSARSLRVIQDQLNHAFAGNSIEAVQVLGTGCMAEVVQVKIKGNSVDGVTVGECVAKTVDPEQKALFDEDIQFFANLSSHLQTPLGLLERVDEATGQEAKAAASKVTDMAQNGELAGSVRGGFDMHKESNNIRAGKELLRKLGDGPFFVPEVFAASHDVLLMQMVIGQPIEKGVHSAEVFVKQFIGLFKKMVMAGHIHQDLHPANIFQCPDGKYALLDWGEVVHIPETCISDVVQLLKNVAVGNWAGDSSNSHAELFGRLSVTVKPGMKASEENWLALANLFDMVLALRGDADESTRTLVRGSVFLSPGWFEGLQKAINAIVITCQAMQITPEQLDTLLRDELME